ncbi:MAG: hypothetical protein A2Y97_09965 [Nitrospirae bacterium RBG_13_39_12]|nr:MAG: hypothetical protein A2Y97_09965 [Nitrospirae bacterium RBG_13_39_12]
MTKSDKNVALLMTALVNSASFPISLTRKMQLTAGMCAAKALGQHLCERFNNPDFLHVFIIIP